MYHVINRIRGGGAIVTTKDHSREQVGTGALRIDTERKDISTFKRNYGSLKSMGITKTPQFKYFYS